MTRRWGLTIPLPAVGLPDHANITAELPDLGYTDVWSAEVAGADAFTPLALTSVWAPTLRLGTAIVPAFTRGPALVAMQAAALAEAAPGRVALGIGASSPVIVRDWNAVPFEHPYQRTRDLLRLLRKAFSGEMVDEAFESFTVRRFRLERVPAEPPSILLAALRPGMLRLAAAEADGAILNWLSVEDVATVRAELRDTKPDFEIAARIFVCPTTDSEFARQTGRRLIAAYMTVPAYAAFHRWLGRHESLGPLWELWASGDRRAAAASVPDEVVDALIVHGSPEQCREHVLRYQEAGVGTPAIALLPTPELSAGGPARLMATIRALGHAA